MRVAVCSKSPVKLEAAKQAIGRLDIDHEGLVFVGVDAPSEVPGQPLGMSVIAKGATARLAGGKELEPEADLWISMENGLAWWGGPWVDIAVVKVELAETKTVGTATSVGVEVSKALMVEATRPGKTVGKAVVDRMGGDGDHANPHLELTGGYCSRVDLLADAVRAAYGVATRK